MSKWNMKSKGKCIKQYNITLSEEELNKIIGELGIGYHYATDELLSAYKKLKQAKSKPYTNFLKIKEKLTVDDFTTLLRLSGMNRDFRNKYGINDENYTTEEWLKSEAKE